MRYRRTRGSLDGTFTDIFNSLDGESLDIVGSLDQGGPIVDGGVALVQTGTLTALVQTGTLTALIQTGTG